MTTDFGFYSIIMTTSSLVTLIRTRLWILSEGIIDGPVFPHTSRTTVRLAWLELDSRPLDTDHMVTTSYPQETMKFNLHGLHWTTTTLTWVHNYPTSCGLTLKKRNIYSDPQHNHSMQLAQLFLLHVFSKHGVHLALLQIPQKALDMRLHFTYWYHPEGGGHSAQIYARYVDNAMTLYCLRCLSRCLADYTLYMLGIGQPGHIQLTGNMYPLIWHLILQLNGVKFSRWQSHKQIQWI